MQKADTWSMAVGLLVKFSKLALQKIIYMYMFGKGYTVNKV